MNAVALRRSDVYCPHCRTATTIDTHGRCMNIGCDQVVLGGTLPVSKRGPAARYIKPSLLREAYDLYLQGLSTRRVAALIVDRTEYANAKTCAVQICSQWRQLGWPLRDRIVATTATSWKHGLSARDPAKRDADHRRRQRIARGEIQDVQCAAIKTRYGKGRGERCQRPAMLDGKYCHNHEPRLRDHVCEHLADVRARRKGAA